MEITTALLAEYIAQRKIQILRSLFGEYNIVNLAECAQALGIEDILFLLKILPKDISGALFSYFSIEKQQEVIEIFNSAQIKEILDNLFTDDITEMLSDLPANLQRKVLQAVSAETRKEINEILSYPENEAGSLMSTDFVEIKNTDTIKKAIERIKQQGKIAETVTQCYVIDDKRRLVGALALQDIMFENQKEKVADHMDSDVISVLNHTDQEEVSHTMQRYDLLVVPVVNDENCLIGIITVDDIMDVIQAEVTEDIHKMAAIRPLDDSYLKVPVMHMAMSRVPWLLFLMVSATLTGMILTRYETVLATVPALAAFVPTIMGTAGNAGQQSAVMVIRGISVDGMKFSDLFSVVSKESKISFYIAGILFLVSLCRSVFLPPNAALNIAVVVSAAIATAILFANVLGGILPLIALKLKVDPAAMAAPLITTIVDGVTLVVYFFLCTAFLGL
ncbi:MAG: magnesium transporter [Erysipelotrichaceae bacterium]|jgi:magnesium transporter|nr:magnesium transporter [Erysipelotrichaceae bacterium]